jgi:hypothetical protein
MRGKDWTFIGVQGTPYGISELLVKGRFQGKSAESSDVRRWIAIEEDNRGESNSASSIWRHMYAVRRAHVEAFLNQCCCYNVAITDQESRG